MVRISKQAQRRSQYRKKHKNPSPKTGPRKDNLPLGFKEHKNASEGDFASAMFVPKIK